MHTQEHTAEGRPWMNMSSAMQACIQNCIDCFQVCSHLIEHCLTKGGKHASPQHIKLLSDCEKICNISADFMIRHSDFHSSICSACAEICNACADSCEAISAGDEMMKVCAQVCRKCAGSCAEMAKMQ